MGILVVTIVKFFLVIIDISGKEFIVQDLVLDQVISGILH